MIFPQGEKIVETKKCHISGQDFFVTDKDLIFYDKISPIFNGKKYSIPSPTLCPDERQRRRISWRNDRNLYHRTCDFSQKDMITMYAPDKDYTVYETAIWFGDKWSPYDYGRSFDFEISAIKNFSLLLKKIPLLARSEIDNQNSPYVNHSAWNKNCHLIFYSDRNEGCYYLDNSFHNRDCLDSSFLMRSELCYECLSCLDCYNVFWSKNSSGCRDSFFLEDCAQCKNCFGCIGLQNREYSCFNEQLTEEDYQKRIQSLSFSDKKAISEIKGHISQKLASFPRRYYMGRQNQGFFGNYMVNNEHVYACFDIEKSRNCKYVYEVENSRDCMDVSGWGGKSLELAYECFSAGDGAYCVAFSDTMFGGQKNTYYSHWCGSGENVFLSSAIRHGKNVVLNKPYSVQEYEELCGKIIDHMRSTGEWGEFFPHKLSPFGYNETVAQEYFPLTESEVRAKGWNWYTEPVRTFEGNSIQPLPINQYDEKVVGFEIAQKNIDELLSSVIKCEVTGKPFKIIRQELAFYIENGIPIPTKHPDQRHAERMALRNPRKLFERNCSECTKDIITTYAPDRPERVVCEECYRKLVY